MTSLLPHCGNCGEAIEQDEAGNWLHTVSPRYLDPSLCIAGTTDGVAYTWGELPDRAEPCKDTDCTQSDEETCAPPWWFQFLKEKA